MVESYIVMAEKPKRNSGLLTSDNDPYPVTVINEGSTSPLLLVCEHAGRHIPKSLNNLGLNERERAMHIAYDIGAEQVARGIAKRFGCRLVLQEYSRLTIDCNRRFGEPSSIPEVSDSILIPGNKNLDQAEIEQRHNEIFRPFAERCLAEIARPEISITFSIHSFTKQMSDGNTRPWDISFLYRDKHSQGDRISELCKTLWPDLVVGQNEPYFIDEKTDWFIPVCAESRQIPHSLIEIRNDHIRTPQACLEWADRLSKLISRFMEQHHATHP